MKLKKNTWFLLVCAIVLSGWVYFYEIRLEAQKILIEQQEKKIFDFDIDNIQRITILRAQKSLELIEKSDASEAWLMKKPEAFEINPGVISFLLNLIEQGRKENKLLITQDQLFRYGLDKPLATITIQLNNQQIHQILLGKATINPKLIYAQIKPSKVNNTTIEIVLISKNWHYAVFRKLQEWKND